MLIQADTEIEGVNMALGAAATGARAATGSTGQGVALMQETIAEAALNELPLVIFTMGRGQQDYFQCTRGGGWGDYRTITLAPVDVVEAAEHTRLAFELADQWLTPVIVYGDHMIGFTQMTVEHDPERAPAPVPDKPWALDGSTGGTGRSKVIWTWRNGKHNTPGLGPDQHWRNVADKYDQAARVEARHVAAHLDGARHLVVSFGTTGPVRRLRRRRAARRRARDRHVPAGHAVAVPGRRARRGRPRGCEQVLVYELNAGQMVDDVRLAVNGAVPGALDRGREPGRVGHAPGRAARRRHHPREDSRGNRRSRSMTEGTPVSLAGARKVAPFAPDLLQSTEHHLCSGCGHPVAWRLLVEVLDELDLVDRSIGVVGHGCYTQIITTADVEFLQCLHGRAPAVATGDEAHAARPRDLHAAGRRRHGVGGPRRGAAHRGARRVDHLPHARQRRVRRHRRPDDRDHDRRPAHEDRPRRRAPRAVRLPDPGRRHRGARSPASRTSRVARSTSPTRSSRTRRYLRAGVRVAARR